MAITQVFTNQLNFVAGYYGRGMLQKVLLPEAGHEAKAIAGRCGYINTAGKWQAGPTPTGKGVPMFVWRGTNHADVYNSGSDGTTTYWQSGNARGFITCFAGTGGFEFQTTEFTGTPANGDPLTVDADGKIISHSGVSYATGGSAVAPVVGFASPFHQTPENFLSGTNNNQAGASPVGVNMHNKSVLNFYTWFVPKSV